MFSSEQVVINRLVYRGRNGEERKAALLNSVSALDMLPPGIPPSAILIIRKMADPSPGGFRVTPGGLQDNREWELALREGIASWYHLAARPEGGRIDPYAVAVLFRDPAEMYACLALGLAEGTVSGAWWWEVYLRSRGPGFTLRDLFLQEVRYLPAMLSYLTGWKQSRVVLENLGTAAGKAVIREVTDVFGLQPLTDVFTTPGILSPERKTGSLPRGDASSPAGMELLSPVHPSRGNPWAVIAGTGWAGQEPVKSMLLALGLLLQTRPRYLSSPLGRMELEEWWAYVVEQWQFTPGEQGGEVGKSRRQGTELPGKREQAVDTPVEKVREPHLLPEQQLYREETGQAPPTGLPEKEQWVPGTGTGEQPPVFPQSVENPENTSLSPDTATMAAGPWEIYPLPPEEKERKGKPLEREIPVTDSVPPVQSAAEGEGKEVVPVEIPSPEWGLRLFPGREISSCLCGVFYLLNIFPPLDLLRVFEAEWELTAQAGSWGLLEILARGLLAEELPFPPEEAAADPLWPLLAQLAGREAGELPAYELSEGHTADILPPEWREWTGPRSWTPDKKSAGKIEPGSPGHFPGPLAEHLAPGLKQWLRLVVPAVRSYLGGLLNPGSREQGVSLVELLCAGGMIYCSSSHLDVVFPLGSILLPVRLAGLDRNPGWLPDFARVVGFHFR